MSMKLKLLWVTFVSVFVTILGCTSCVYNEIDPSVNAQQKQELSHSKTNEIFDGVAQTISRMMRESVEFRRTVKALAITKFDGDYDIMLKTLGSQKVADFAMSRNKETHVSVAEIFDELFPNYSRSVSRDGIIDELIEMYPMMQISVPYHAEDWQDGYIPTVIFLDENYQENVTEYVKGYDAEGKEVWVDAMTIPDVPIIVVGFNERSGLSVEEQDAMLYSYMQQHNNKVISETRGPIHSPIDSIHIDLKTVFLQVNVTESDICLSWITSANYNPTMYNIYRKMAGESQFTKIATNSGTSNRTYHDVDYVSLQSYDYYIEASDRSITTPNIQSNIVSCIAPGQPEPISSLELTPINLTKLMLSWSAPDVYCDSLVINRINLTGSGDIERIATLPHPHSSSDVFQDEDITPGQRYLYQLMTLRSGNYSDSVRDLFYAPYRNVHISSPIYVEKMGYDVEVNTIEGIFQGAPEFYLTILNANESQNVSSVGVADRIIFAFNDRDVSNQDFINRKIMNWLPNNNGWMDNITIHAAEYDLESDDPTNVELKVKLNIKIAEAATVELGEVAINHTFTPRRMDSDCGEVSLNYFDNPQTRLYFPNYGFYIDINDEQQ